MEVACLFCLFVSLDDPPLLACVDTEKMGRRWGWGGKEKLSFISTYEILWNMKTTLKMDL